MAVALVRGRYADFGPTLAHEKLVEVHRLPVSLSTLRVWMMAEGIWTTRRERASRAYQPRPRRACLAGAGDISALLRQCVTPREPSGGLRLYGVHDLG